ncbi:MAG TPA: dihydrolipoamide acetyltransferase family protein [Sphingomonas sp.]|uniref:dihydrolipoamide acetyltransferase family protein n=1 Tax=Sphingomonas sp. TaxID=28214 RepID=UPI002B9CA535|nr:dihydrolipoamide acetyltransferase family protein [Sphingomonas sp.]HMI17901.1 dihydrolipoamide acetyltransferase family protein [Sphingomonas sp.]
MSRYSFKLPDIGEGIAEAEIVAWHVKIGDTVAEDDPLCDMMTDKATVEMTAPVAGKVIEVAGEVGDLIAIGSVLAVFEAEGAVAAEPLVEVAPNEAAEVVKPDPIPEPAPVAKAAAPALAQKVEAPAPAPAEHRRVLASPAVRERAKNLGIDLAQVKAEGDRIRHSDLDAFLTYNQGYRAAGGSRPDEQIKVVGLRRRIAENMQASKRHIPHFTYVEEFDVTKLEALRADLNETRGGKDRLTILPFLIVAMCRALPKFPMINARYDDEANIITRSGAIHLGIAAQTDAGLMVPVIHDAQAKNIWQLSAEVKRLAEAARTGKAKSEELSGSTLTLSSLGPLGGIAATPVINRPEVAILCPNKVVERPVVKDGQIVIAKIMNMSISCDHRVVDGHDAASFVQAVKKLVETPALLFVD